MSTRPEGSTIVASRCARISTGFGATPPLLPEWLSRSAPWATSVIPRMPRLPSEITGAPDGCRPPSEMYTRSAASRARCSRTNAPRLGEPDSSSPSNTNLRLIGGPSAASSQARAASTCASNCPLLSPAPRPNNRPSRLRGLDVVVPVAQERVAAGVADDLAVDDRLRRRRNDLGGDTEAPEQRREVRRAFLDALVLRADAGTRHQIPEDIERF